MGRLEEFGIHSIVWEEDPRTMVIHAHGLQDYEISTENRLFIYQGDDCVAEHPCQSLQQAVYIAEASEKVCRWNISHKSTWPGHPVNERGWRILPDGPYKTRLHEIESQIEIKLFAAYDGYSKAGDGSVEEQIALVEMEAYGYCLGLIRGTDETVEQQAIQEKWNEVYGS